MGKEADKGSRNSGEADHVALNGTVGAGAAGAKEGVESKGGRL
jgi:hypothetical protein